VLISTALWCIQYNQCRDFFRGDQLKRVLDSYRA